MPKRNEYNEFTIARMAKWSAKERLRILREAKPNSWLAFSADESRVVGSGDTYSEVVEAAEKAGEPDPVIIRIPEDWNAIVT